MGDKEVVQKRIKYLDDIPDLLINELVEDLASGLVSSRAIPKKAAQDAAHIAIAAVHSMDYLLTWNCRHIANAELIPIVVKVCSSYGFTCPLICTPEELMGEK